MSANPEPIAYTVREAAEMVRVSERTIRRRIADGRLTIVRIGRCVRVPRQTIIDLLSAGTLEDSANKTRAARESEK